MFDQHAQGLIDLIPDLPTLDRAECRRALSAAFLYTVRTRVGMRVRREEVEDLRHTFTQLRRMVDALESVAVFDCLHGTRPRGDEHRACAFVAAEALSVLSVLARVQKADHHVDPWLHAGNFAAIKSSLLYLVGGYDIDAVASMRLVESSPEQQGLGQFAQARVASAMFSIARIMEICNAPLPPAFETAPPVGIQEREPRDYSSLVDDIRGRLYVRLGAAAHRYLEWLEGRNEDGHRTARHSLNECRRIAAQEPNYTSFGDIHHIASLLDAAIEETSSRALVHTVPPPTRGDAAFGAQFTAYLLRRARGTVRERRRLYLWPSAAGYVSQCLPDNARDAVVSMPTGSGKSFVGELAIVHGLSQGWVLYLAPTNALCHQVRRDLVHALLPFENVTVRAFVGAEEYTTLTEEQIGSDEQQRFVAVMTPEKCTLALRLAPDAFASCSLCVFDECHLLNDGNRGITADIAIAELGLRAPRLRFLLMSAMVSNAEELAEWLQNVRNSEAIPLKVAWRPSRTLRGLLIVDAQGLREGFASATERLRQLPAHRKNETFSTATALIAGLSGPWTRDGEEDYRLIRLPDDAAVQASRKNGRYIPDPQFVSWKNSASRDLAARFAASGIPAICFVLSSRHHTFSSAEKVADVRRRLPEREEGFPPLVGAWLSLAEAELGVISGLREALQKGISVHSSAMLQTEQAASEWMFRRGYSLLMFATPTLAQGLNLPAVAVVVAGTSMGDPRDADNVAGVSRVNATILNGFGRAGRPGFANQGIAVLVSDNPYSAPVELHVNASSVLDNYPVLGEPDATVEVHSPIERFLDSILLEDLFGQLATQTELELTSVLAEYSDDRRTTGRILRGTLAAYHRRDTITTPVMDRIEARISQIKEQYIAQPGLPQWINTAAMKSGVDFDRARLMWLACGQEGVWERGLAENTSVELWLGTFFQVMGRMPPKQIEKYMADETAKKQTVLKGLRDSVRDRVGLNTSPWERPEGWEALWSEMRDLALMYMKGHTFAEIAKAFLGLGDGRISHKRTAGDHPIPAVFGLVGKIILPLSVDAGCFLAILECWLKDQDAENAVVPEELQALPLCIRNGCNTLDTLAWFRFGYRERVAAHAFARVLPLPPAVNTDTERAAWVRTARRDWLSHRIEVQPDPILENVRTVLVETDGE